MMPYKGDAYSIRVVNLNIGSVELLRSKGGVNGEYIITVLFRAGCMG